MAVLDSTAGATQLELGMALPDAASALDLARRALRMARPFVALEAGLANSGYGMPGQGDAPQALAAIDVALGAADEVLRP